MSIHIQPSGAAIADKVLLPGDPLRAKYIAETFLENAVCYNQVRGMLGYTGSYHGKTVSIQGTGMGMPHSGELSSLCGQTKIRSRCERNRTEAVVVHIGVGRGRCRDDYVLDVYAFADRAAGANADGSFYAEILHQLCSIDAE